MVAEDIAQPPDGISRPHSADQWKTETLHITVVLVATDGGVSAV